MLVNRVILFFIFNFSLFASPLQLAKIYSDEVNVTNWYISEKLDGVRAYWDGEKLISRGGYNFNPPKFFIKNFPNFALDGELWTKRGDFENITSITKSGKGWEKLTYNIFEVPKAEGNFSKRLFKIKNYLKDNPTKYIKVIPQITCKSKKHLKETFEELIKNGAEGVMVKNPFVSFEEGRSDNLLKLKPYFDDEAKVIGYREGKGKYKGLLGSLLVEYKNKKFFIGSGFSDKERKSPPKIGDIITFKYSGFTKRGLPKFPVFLRVRDEK